MKKLLVGLLAGFFLWVLPGTPAQAEKAEWSDSGYNFGAVQYVLVVEPSFKNESFDLSGNNKFKTYTYGPEKVRDLLQASLGSLPRYRFVNIDYVRKQIQAYMPPGEVYDPKAPGFAALVKRELPKHVQLVLQLEVRDYGWYYEYHDAYTTTRTTTERVYYNRKNRDGTETSGWTDVPRTVVDYHPAGYFISDSAGVEFRLSDAASGKDVWKYSDSRLRKSPPLSNGYDPSGPESMMKRIFEDAFKRIPLVPSDMTLQYNEIFRPELTKR